MVKVIGIIAAVIVALGLMVGMFFVSINNHVIGLEENIKSSQSNISKEEQRRVDLFGNLVDAIESYNKYEQNTMDNIVKARSQAHDGNVEKAQKTIDVVVEAYPELKAQDNYKTAMKEFSVTENRLASHRGNYNDQVKSYNRYIKRFPASFVLNMSGYEQQNYEYLDFKVDNSKATNLFGK